MSTLQTIKDSAKDLNSSDPVKKARAEEIKRRYTQGLFNAELIKEGAKPVPVPKPKIDLGAAMASVTQVPGLQSKVPEAPKQGSVGPFDVGMSGASLKERAGDIKETALGFFDQLGTAGQDIVETAKRDDRSLAEKATMIGGRAFSGGSGAIGELFTGLGKLALTQEAEDGLKQIATNVGENVSETELAQKAIGWYNGLDPRTKDQVDAAGGFAMALAEIVGLKGAGKVAKTTADVVDAAAPVVKKGMDVAGDVVETAIDTAKKVPDVVQKVVTKSPEAADAALTESVKRVIQTPATDTATQAKHVAAAKDTLTRIAQTGTKDLTDYATLKNKIETSAKGIREAKAAYLAKFPETYKPERLAIGETVDGITQGWSPVEQALDGLEQAYKSSGDIAKSLEFKQLRTKLENEGLTVSEIDDIAAKYGTEYRAKAFDKMGNVRPGFNADNFESVRRGVKKVAREKLPDDFAKLLDEQLSHDITTKQLVDRMAAVVQKRVDKLPKTSKLRQGINVATNTVVGTVDLLTGRVMSNIMKAIASRAGVLQKASLSPIELQDELRKQMKIIEKMDKIKDPKAYEKAIKKYLAEDVSVGLSIRSTVRPDLVAKKLDKNTYRDVIALLDDVSLREEPDYAELLTNLGLKNADDKQLRSFLEEVVDEYEGAADIPLRK